MTAALIALCAVLASALIREGYANIQANRRITPQRQRIDRDAALIAEAYALLHDTAARAKDGRWKPWAEARQKWAEKAGKV